MRRWLIWSLLLLVAAGAGALRMPQLDQRPMHTDESVHAIKFLGLWEQGTYAYDPNEYHGPSLYYLTLPLVKLSSARTRADLSETTLRLVPLVFGVALILLLPMVRHGLGAAPVLGAGVLTALSPAMVFYSRYYIHEMLLVVFTFIALGAGWRYTQSRRPGWAALAGLGLGLMYATKETFVLAIGAMVLAAIIESAWTRGVERKPVELMGFFSPGPWMLSLAVAVGVSMLLFTSFFTNWRGPLDSVRTYLPWLGRAGGGTVSALVSTNDFLNLPAFVTKVRAQADPVSQFLWAQLTASTHRLLLDDQAAPVQQRLALVEDLDRVLRGEVIYTTPRFAGVTLSRETIELHSRKPQGKTLRRLNRLLLEDAYPREIARSPRPQHVHPWNFYLQRLFYFHHGRGPVWTEGLILVLAVAGFAAGLARRGLGDAHPALVRFLGFYTVILTAAYSVLPYKTPWCMLGFLHGLILLAGVGAMVLVRLMPGRSGRWAMGVVLAGAAGQLGWQAYRTSYTYCTDQQNPYVYAQTLPDLLTMVKRVEGVARASPAGDRMLIRVIATRGDYWPLPWYLRRFNQVGWYSQVPADPAAQVIITSPRFDPAIEGKLGPAMAMVGYFGQRPASALEQPLFVLRVQSDLWQEYLKSKPPPDD